MDVKEEKRKLREKIWEEMERLGIARFPLPCFGRIPNFLGAEKAALLLRELEEYRRAKNVFVNPDSPQFYVRRQTLLDGKTVVMASPGLKAGFIILKPDSLKGMEGKASTIKGAFKHGELSEEIPRVDLVVQGSVAVDMHGNRLGKGLGLGDKEISLIEKLAGESIPILTTVHDIQVVDFVPREKHDKRVNIIVTPSKILRLRS